MLVTTPAVVLHAFPYGETSRIVRLATPEWGVQSVIAKGAMRPKSPFGGRLQALSEGIAQFHHHVHRDLHTLSAFDLTDQHASLAGDVARYAAATALAELVLRFAQEEPQPAVYRALATALGALADAALAELPYVALAALWHEIVILGFGPTVDACVRCGAALGNRAQFSIAEGGLLCPRCGRAGGGKPLGADDVAALRAFTAGSYDVVPVTALHLAAHRRLFARFVRRHVADDRELPALAFWETPA
jgi:DNA repair protein RecO (recombination protein O)